MPVGVSFGRIRTWGTPTGWKDTEKTRGSYDFTQLNKFISDVSGPNHSGVDVEITTGAGDVPCWANGTNCDHGTLPNDDPYLGVCTNIPPDVVGIQGAHLFAGDCFWQEYVYNLAENECVGCDPVNHVYRGVLNFRSFSPGNEVDIHLNVDGGFPGVNPPCNLTNQSTCPQLVKMQIDACKILHWVDSTFTGCGMPSFTNADNANYYLGLYISVNYGGDSINATPKDYTDILIGHVYGDLNFKNAGQPELPLGPAGSRRSWPMKIQGFTAVRNSQLPGKKFRIDEGGWGENFQTNLDNKAQPCSASVCGCANLPQHANSCMDADSLSSSNYRVNNEINAPAPGYIVRSYLEALSNGAESFFWFTPGAGEWGSFADCGAAGNSCNVGTFVTTASTYAYLSLYQWTVGATFDSNGIQNPNSSVEYTYAILRKGRRKSNGLLFKLRRFDLRWNYCVDCRRWERRTG
jgi:hypothetical protein